MTPDNLVRVNRSAILDKTMADIRALCDAYSECGVFLWDDTIERPIQIQGTVGGICSHMAKAAGRPWISAIFNRHNQVVMTMPARADLKVLRTPILMVGTEVHRLYLSTTEDVAYSISTKSRFDVLFSRGGVAAFHSWMDYVRNDKACRFALKLPLK